MKLITVNNCLSCPHSFNTLTGEFHCQNIGLIDDSDSSIFKHSSKTHRRCPLPNVEKTRDILPPEIMYPKIGIGVIVYHPTIPTIPTIPAILVGKRKGSHGAGLYAFPGGHLDYKESPEECAIREYKEETDLIIENPKTFHHSNDYFPNYNKHFYHIWMTAELVGEPSPKLMEPDKCEGWEWRTVPELRELYKKGVVFEPLYNLIKAELL